MATLKGDLPRGYEHVERRIATLYPPVDPNLLGAVLHPMWGQTGASYPAPFEQPPTRDVRVRLGKLELWESGIQPITNGK